MSNELKEGLTAAVKRNPGALQVLSAVSGIPLKRLKEIAKGAEPTFSEKTMLEMLR